MLKMNLFTMTRKSEEAELEAKLAALRASRSKPPETAAEFRDAIRRVEADKASALAAEGKAERDKPKNCTFDLDAFCDPFDQKIAALRLGLLEQSLADHRTRLAQQRKQAAAVAERYDEIRNIELSRHPAGKLLPGDLAARLFSDEASEAEKLLKQLREMAMEIEMERNEIASLTAKLVGRGRK